MRILGAARLKRIGSGSNQSNDEKERAAPKGTDI
jgi:hypothetical protein